MPNSPEQPKSYEERRDEEAKRLADEAGLAAAKEAVKDIVGQPDDEDSYWNKYWEAYHKTYWDTFYKKRLEIDAEG